MRYAIKYGGVIYVGTFGAVVRAAEAEHGVYRRFGQPFPEGWIQEAEPVNEDLLDLFRMDYEVREVE